MLNQKKFKMDGNGDASGTSYLNLDGQNGWNIQYDIVKMENQSPDLKISHHTTPAPRLNLVPQSYSTPALLQNIQPSQLASMATAAAAKTSTTTAIMNGNAQNTTKPHLRIVEQPAQNNQRFRYMVEGRSAGSLKGVNSTPENSTYPTIEIANYNKKAVVIVSCVTADKPYRPHPHKMVGRDCKDGICQLTLNEPPLRASFNNLGIQCTKKKDMEQSLEERRRKKINPFNTPYTKDQKIDYDLHVVRLCFQPFIDPTGNGWEPLDAVVSDPIIDSKKQMGLSICQLCGCAARANGGDRKILLCEKVDKNDIKIKFTEFFAQGGIKWYAYADFNPQDVHKQTAIYFKTPSYERTDITEPVTVFIQLERPSDKAVSEPMEFQFTPDPDRRRPPMQTSAELRDYLNSNGFTYSYGATPELKVEQMTSPEHYSNQNSPYPNIAQSPSPQSPHAMGVMQQHYITLSPSQSGTNPFLNNHNINSNDNFGALLSPAATPTPTPNINNNSFPTTMSGGSFIPLHTEETTTNFNFMTNNYNNIQQHQQQQNESIQTDSIQLLANKLEADANAIVLNNGYNYNNYVADNILNNTTMPTTTTTTSNDGLTDSGIIRIINDAAMDGELTESGLMRMMESTVATTKANAIATTESEAMEEGLTNSGIIRLIESTVQTTTEPEAMEEEITNSGLIRTLDNTELLKMQSLTVNENFNNSNNQNFKNT